VMVGRPLQGETEAIAEGPSEQRATGRNDRIFFLLFGAKKYVAQPIKPYLNTNLKDLQVKIELQFATK
jgi:hypothetical protein